MTGLMANSLFMAGLDDPNASKLGVIAAAQTLGSIPGAIPAPWLADRFGRRITLGIGYVLEIIGALVQTFAGGGWNMLGGRFILGFGVAITTIAGAAYTAEIAHPRNRAQTTSLIQTFFFVGAIIAAWVAFGGLYLGDTNAWSWKMCVLFQIVVPLYVLGSLPFIPESPRWLVAKGRQAEAHHVLAKYHANGDGDDELVLFELEEIKETIASEQRAQQVSYMTFFQSKGNRHRLLILIVS
jgi:MFS family permease